MLASAMPRTDLPPFQRLREDLQDALVQADALDLALVAIRITQALDELLPGDLGEIGQAT